MDCTFLRSFPSERSKQHEAMTQPLPHGHSDARDSLVFLLCCPSQSEAQPVDMAYTARMGTLSCVIVPLATMLTADHLLKSWSSQRNQLVPLVRIVANLRAVLAAHEALLVTDRRRLRSSHYDIIIS